MSVENKVDGQDVCSDVLTLTQELRKLMRKVVATVPSTTIKMKPAIIGVAGGDFLVAVTRLWEGIISAQHSSIFASRFAIRKKPERGRMYVDHAEEELGFYFDDETSFHAFWDGWETITFRSENVWVSINMANKKVVGSEDELIKLKLLLTKAVPDLGVAYLAKHSQPRAIRPQKLMGLNLPEGMVKVAENKGLQKRFEDSLFDQHRLFAGYNVMRSDYDGRYPSNAKLSAVIDQGTIVTTSKLESNDESDDDVVITCPISVNRVGIHLPKGDSFLLMKIQRESGKLYMWLNGVFVLSDHGHFYLNPKNAGSVDIIKKLEQILIDLAPWFEVNEEALAEEERQRDDCPF